MRRPDQLLSSHISVGYGAVLQLRQSCVRSPDSLTDTLNTLVTGRPIHIHILSGRFDLSSGSDGTASVQEALRYPH